MAMEEYKADNGCAVGNGMVGMVIGGRAAKACDVCGKERARWYCAADLAYLCERCDGSVHTANALARRHERVRLGPNGAPMKIARSTPAVNTLKREAAVAAAQTPAAHLSPRKRPRSIRRHKPSSLHASKHGISLINECNYHNSSSILGSNHSIMINNPRNDPEFINNNSNNNNDYFNKVLIKAEPYSPIDIGDQVKVPDYTDDDPLLESLFDFTGDLQDDDLFLHEVPIYSPLVQSQNISPSSLHSELCEGEEEEEEAKPIILPIPSENSRENVINTSSCAIHHSSVLSQSQGVSQDSNGALPLGKCDVPDQFIDSDTDICDLDQLDFDSVLHGHDEDGDETDHAASMGGSAFHVHDDVKESPYTEISDGHTLSRDEDGYGDGMDENINGQYDGHHIGYGETSAFDFDATGSESPRTWLCKVKVESPPQLGMMKEDEDVLLREKLSTCQSLCSDSPNGFKLGLRLNFEDVLNAWSDRGTFWMDGQPPHHLSSCLDFLGGWMVPDMNSPSIEGSEGQQLVPVLHHKNKSGDGGARKASVLRYREKRRTRLFSKKIRYEVRKLNAEKRPRMKGRFVKRISIDLV